MTLLFPAGLLMGALAIPITAMYFLKIRRKRVVVPSLMLWHALKQAERQSSPFDRFRRHWLLPLQLLLLLFLVLALSRPVWSTLADTHQTLALVVDTSASMGATDGAPTRLASALREASDLLDGLGPEDEVLVIEAGHRTTVRVPFTRDLEDVRQTLEGLAPSQAEGALFEGLQLALSLTRSRPDVQIVVLSDGGNESLATLPPTDAEIRYVRVGSSSVNAGILTLDLRRNPTRSLDRQVFVTAQHFGSKPVQGTMEIYLDDVLVEVRNAALTPGTPVSMVFDLPSGQSGVLHAHLDVPGDRLAADDHAYALVGQVAARKVTLVGGDALLNRVLRADPRIELTRVRTTEATLENLAGADAVLFAGGRIPTGLEGVHLGLLSRRVGGPATLGDLQPLPRVTRWTRSHPVLRFVDFQGSTIAKAATVTRTATLTPIVEADTGPLILAGEQKGGRVVQFAFDPHESDLPLRVAWPVLVLNTVGWLTEKVGGSGSAAMLPAGQPYLRNLPGTTGSPRIVGPNGRVDVSFESGTLRVLDTATIGVYRGSVDGVDISFAANLLSKKESQITTASNLELPQRAAIEGQSTLKSGTWELWRPLLLLALLLLVLEWWGWNRARNV